MTMPSMPPLVSGDQDDSAANEVILGVDTPHDVHVAAVITALGVLLGTAQFPTTAAGYQALVGWVDSFGMLRRAGVEGTGSYGAALTRHLRAAGVEVIEVNAPDKPHRDQKPGRGRRVHRGVRRPQGPYPTRPPPPGRSRRSKPASCISSATPSATPATNTGTNWPGTCGRSTPRSMPRWPRCALRSSPTSGAPAIRRSSGCGGPRGRSFIPFLDYDVEIRKILCSTNAVESLNRRYRRAIGARGHFPT